MATPGPDTARYGGNTSCVAVQGREGSVLVLDAGTGIRCMAATLDRSVRRVDVLLTHLHMDHIQGLGFFGPLYRPDVEVHIWGPASTQMCLQSRLMRYLSPPLFPVGLRELPCQLTLHEVPCGDVDIGEFRVTSALVCHPGPTVGYRISDAKNGKIKAAGARALEVKDVEILGRDVIHSVTNPVNRLTGAIHIYGGQFFSEPRSEWDPETLLEGQYDLEKNMRLFEDSNRRLTAA